MLFLNLVLNCVLCVVQCGSFSAVIKEAFDWVSWLSHVSFTRQFQSIYRSAQTLHCGRAHSIMMYRTCQCPWGKSVQKLLQVLTMATSTVDVSKHWITSYFFSPVLSRNQIFLQMWPERTSRWLIALVCECVFFLKPSNPPHLPLFSSAMSAMGSAELV